MRSRSVAGVLMLIIAAGAALRLWLALGPYAGQGFAGDLQDFVDWSYAYARVGPERFYLLTPDANYPPVSILTLGGLQALSHPVSSLLGSTAGHAFLIMLKLPAVLADLITIGVVYLLGRRVHRPAVGLLAAGLYALVPPIWYVSAVWGQIDSIMIMFTALALVALASRLHVLAGTAAVLAMMVKPQGVLIVIVVAVVVIMELIGGRRRWGRLIVAALVPAVIGIGLLVWFGYRRIAAVAAGVPVLGDVAGFVQQSIITSQLFPVLSANAYNGWALVGDPSLAGSISTGQALWYPDTGGPQPYALIGLVAMLVALVLVIIGLAVRRDALAVVFGYTVLSACFFALPTRVHERYLLPAFVGAAVLAAAGIIRCVLYLLAGLLNLVNLHAVLAGPLADVRTPWSADSRGADGRFGGPPGGGAGFGGGSRTGGTLGSGSEPRDAVLPWAAQARSELVAVAVSFGQLTLAVGLLAVWMIFIGLAVRARRRDRSRPAVSAES